MYEVVGAALLATLRAFARDAFTSEAEKAWTQVYAAGLRWWPRTVRETLARDLLRAAHLPPVPDPQ